MKIEIQRREGKIPLNKEQEALIPMRQQVEKALADVEAIKIQLEEVAKEVITKIRLNRFQIQFCFSASCSIYNLEAKRAQH